MSVSALAAEYSVTPFGTMRTEADSNKRLTTQDSDTTFGAVLDVGALFNAANDSSSLNITPRFSIGRFSDDGNNVDQDKEDYFLDVNGAHRFNDRFSAGATFGYANAGVVGAELEDIGLVVSGGDVFAIGNNTNLNENFSRETISGGPSLTYIFSEKDSLTLSGNWADTTYERQDTELADYTHYSLNASWLRQLSPSDQLSVSVFMSKQDPELDFLVRNSAGPSPESLNSEYDEIGMTLGYVHSFSDTLLGRFSAGVRKTDGEFPDLIDFDYNLSAADAALINPFTGLPVGAVIDRLDPLLADPFFRQNNPEFFRDSRIVNRVYQQGLVDNTGLILDASVEKQFEQTTMTAGISRASQPSGRGLTVRDEIYFDAVHLYSDRITASGSVSYYTTESISEETFQNQSIATDQLRVEAGVDWRWTEFWTVGAGYMYARRMADNADSADGHGIFLTLGYNGNKYSISR